MLPGRLSEGYDLPREVFERALEDLLKGKISIGPAGDVHLDDYNGDSRIIAFAVRFTNGWVAAAVVEKFCEKARVDPYRLYGIAKGLLVPYAKREIAEPAGSEPVAEDGESSEPSS